MSARGGAFGLSGRLVFLRQLLANPVSDDRDQRTHQRTFDVIERIVGHPPAVGRSVCGARRSRRRCLVITFKHLVLWHAEKDADGDHAFV